MNQATPNSQTVNAVRPAIRVRPPRSLAADSILVSPPMHDDLGSTLSALGFQFVQAQDDVGFNAALTSARIVFLNCGGIDASPAIIHGLKRLLARGGVVFASDWASDCLESMQIEGLVFHSRIGVGQTVNAQIVDPELRAAMGRKDIEIEFDMAGWVAVEAIPESARVFVRGDITIEESLVTPIEFPEHPLAFSVQVGPGQVIFTSFHNHVQMTELEKSLLSFLALRSIAAATGQTVPQVMTKCRLRSLI